MEKSNFQKSETGIILVISYAVLFIVNCAVIFAANIIFPTQVVLGTKSLSLIWAGVLSMGVLTLINTFAVPIIRVIENSRKKMFTTKDWMVSYFLLNFVGVWLVARCATELGMGISSWVVALVLAVVLDVVQGVAMMQLEKMKKTYKI